MSKLRRRLVWVTLFLSGVALVACGAAVGANRSHRALGGGESAALRGGDCCQHCASGTYCDSSETSCDERTKDECAGYWERVNQKGRKLWACSFLDPKYQSCNVSNYQLCRIDYDCMKVSLGCMRSSNTSEYSANTTCTDSSGTYN